MKHFMSLLDYTHEELVDLLDRADYLADAWKRHEMPKSLLNKQVGLWFYGNGFRNRLAFEIGAGSMGAAVSYILGELGVNEPLEDIGHYLENWYDLLVIRAKSHEDLVYVADKISIPVINARTNFSHPCEIMGDLQFIRKYRGSLDGLKVVFVGEVTNLCMSWFEAAARFPISVTQVAPADYLADPKSIERICANGMGTIKTSTVLEPLIEKVDLVYTDCWPKPQDAQEVKRIREKFLPYQIAGKLLSKLNKNSMFLPCPPVTRGQEVSDDAMKSGLCLNYRAKEYLLHSQNAIMEAVLS